MKSEEEGVGKFEKSWRNATDERRGKRDEGVRREKKSQYKRKKEKRTNVKTKYENEKGICVCVWGGGSYERN